MGPGRGSFTMQGHPSCRSKRMPLGATLLHGYANPLKRLDTSESVNFHKCLILLDSCRIHATRWRDASARMPQPVPAQLGVDAWRAVDPPAGGEDAAELRAQLGFRLGTALDGGDRVQPSVEAADARTDDSAQRGYGVVRPLGRYEGELRHAIPLAKKAAALRRISTSSSSRFTARFSRCVCACSALRTASASAEPAARCSVRHWLSCPVPMPSSVATSDSPLPPSSIRFTACALNSLVKLRRFRLSAILPSWGAWVR